MESLMAEFGKLEALVDSGVAITAFPTRKFRAYLTYQNSSAKGRPANGAIIDSDGIAKVGLYTEDGTYNEMNGEIMDTGTWKETANRKKPIEGRFAEPTEGDI